MRVGLITKKYFFCCVSLSGDMSCVGGSVTTYHYFLLLSQTYVLGNVRSELFFVYGCRLFTFLCCFCFLQQTFILLSILIISKGIFHIGGLVSKMHISVYGYLRNGSASVFCFFVFCIYVQSWDYEYSMHTLNILSLNVNGLNSAVKRTRVLEYLHRKSISCALIQETHLKQSDVARFQNKYYKLIAFSCAQNKTKGVLILVNRKLNLTLNTLVVMRRVDLFLSDAKYIIIG